MTLANWIRLAAARLAAISDTPRLDAELLAAHALGMTREDMILRLPDLAPPGGLDALLERRMAHEPVAQIIGQRDFWTLTLKVTRDVLTPRPDSETLIEAAIDHFKDREPRRILDLGTGTGVLAIAIAKAWHCPVLATDIDPVAVRVTQENAALNHVRWQIEALTAAGFGHANLTRRAPYDLIVANILAGPLIAIAPALARRLAPGAIVVLSGLLVHQGPRVAAAYRAQGLRIMRSRAREGWLTLTLAN